MMNTDRNSIKVSFLINYIGDYHAPRLIHLTKQLARLNMRLEIFQAYEKSSFYTHQQNHRGSIGKNLHLVSPKNSSRLELIANIWSYLTSQNPTHIVVLGYSDLLSLTSVIYANLFRKKIYFLSDSKADDQNRSCIKEIVKKYIIKLFDGALLAGDRHRRYFQSLDFDKPMEIGYDVIDNDFFLKQSQRYRRKLSLIKRKNILPASYVLCVSRLVIRKRLDRVLEIYCDSGIYKNNVMLIIIGDGSEIKNIEKKIKELNLDNHVLLVRDVRNTRMPLYYSDAQALILASEYDQWGLCVNEAMACGVPAIVSDRCGVANELVQDGKTGVVFSGNEIEKAAFGLRQIAEDRNLRDKLSAAALAKMEEWNLSAFSNGICNLVSGTTLKKIASEVAR